MPRLNCSVCGRWVGKDGWEDVSYDMDTGLADVGYPLCKRCLDERYPRRTPQNLERSDK